MILRQRSVLMHCIIYRTLFGTVTSGDTKYICRGEPFQFISYSDIHNCTEVAVYINGVKNLTLIGQWKLEMCTTEKLHMNPEYEGRIDMDRFRNIWILKVDGSDSATYLIKCDKQNSLLEVELHVFRELTEQDQIQKCQHDVICMKNCLADNYSTTMSTDQKEITEETSYHTTTTLDRKTSTEEKLMKQIMHLQSTCLSNPVILAILVIVVFIALGIVGVGIFFYHKYASRQHKKKTENIEEEETKLFCMSDKPSLSLKWRFSGRTRDNKSKPWLLDHIINPDDDLIVTDGENIELKKFTLEGKLKSKLSFETRPDSLALTDGYCVTVTFPQEPVLRVVNTKDVLCLVSTIPFKLQCAGIGSMNDGRLIICNRESKSVIVSTKDGQILQEIKNGSSGETLFRKPSYVRVVDSKTFYVSDYRNKKFFIFNINEDNTFTINKHQINYPRTSCVVDGMLLVAASNIRLYSLDGNEEGEITLDGVCHVRGLAFSEGKRLLAITHQSDADEEILVYEVMKH